MKTILRRMFPEAEVEELYDNPCFAEQMADIGVQFVQKKEDTLMSTSVGERIDALGLKGLLTVNQVLATPRENLNALIQVGRTNPEIAEALGISMAVVSRLRKYYDLGGKAGTKSKSAPVDEANKQALRAAYAAQKMEKAIDAEQEEPITYQPVLEWVAAPLLDITDAGIVLSPLAAGVSKMLERIGEGRVRLVVSVVRVTAE